MLPICHFGSVSLTSVGHLPKEGPQHVAHVVTHAKGQFGENVVVIFYAHIWVTANIKNAPFIEQTGKLKLSNVFVQATQMLATAGNCTKMPSHLPPPVGITAGISEQSHAYLNQQQHRAESRAHQFSDEVSKGAVEIEHCDV